MAAIEVTREARSAPGIRFSVRVHSKEVARAYLYIMRNDLHEAPFGLLEDLYVDEAQRGAGLGSRVVQEVIEAARAAGCYKLVATSRASRPKVHELYRRLGCSEYGTEFSMDLGAC